MKTTTALTTALAAAGLAAAATTGATAGSGDTEATVGPPKPVFSGAKAPFDAPGVRAIRRGKRVPKGYVLVGRTVSVDPGHGAAGAALRVACPKGKTLRTFGSTGGVGGSPADRTAGYVGHRSAELVVFGHGGKPSSGTLYGVCR